MKICYLGNFNNANSDSTEKHISFAFKELGHEVIEIPEITERDGEPISEFTHKEIVEATRDTDLFFFHQGCVREEKTFQRLINVLAEVTCPKVFWFFDKIWQQREMILDIIIPFCDWAFMTDGTWRKSRGFKNTTWLMQGIGNEDTSLGTPREEYKCDVAFTGSEQSNWLPYREKFIAELKKKYGDKFKVFSKVFNRDFSDLCQSAKILVAPKEPQDNFYWSSRIYITLGSGGFMLHPKFEGLKDEFTEGKHFAGYKDFKDMTDKIDYYLEHEKKRKQIQKEGYEYCIANYTYKHRVEKILAVLKENKIL